VKLLVIIISVKVKTIDVVNAIVFLNALLYMTLFYLKRYVTHSQIFCV